MSHRKKADRKYGQSEGVEKNGGSAAVTLLSPPDIIGMVIYEQEADLCLLLNRDARL
ncbi:MULTISPECIES: hypothetical protein [Anoxybacillaceae]|uniref:Uncharacterized protein n=1 Tax=Anoxybacteroides rupiense TaxID=311460 RepID=A0ABD5IWV4_9BACL|nr:MULTISPECIES: hypothetical protein [Anoxybacillus]MED5052820.1 hypothetical protein [Anoxybacillus rupiensis]